MVLVYCSILRGHNLIRNHKRYYDVTTTTQYFPRIRFSRSWENFPENLHRPDNAVKCRRDKLRQEMTFKAKSGGDVTCKAYHCRSKCCCCVARDSSRQFLSQDSRSGRDGRVKSWTRREVWTTWDSVSTYWRNYFIQTFGLRKRFWILHFHRFLVNF